ncbi:hypothetical protein [Neolewinella aurantiaca]|uniref:hypothetical protein n=1 Tax=Neolewinella aurantiaca TaxID=2602767 RepID=UPI00164FA147|nr:hypothetical protein [Neolewinella aurantiaca]
MKPYQYQQPLREVRLPLQQVPRNILRSIVQDAHFRNDRYPKFVVLGYKGRVVTYYRAA